MITNDLQRRIHDGDREAFRTIYAEYGRGVYLNALKTLGNETDARNVVKQTFLNLHHELLRSNEAVDIPTRIRELADNELLLLEILDSKTLTQAAAVVASGQTTAPEAGDSTEDRAASSAPKEDDFQRPVRRPQRERVSFDDDDVVESGGRDAIPPSDRPRAHRQNDDETNLRMREQDRAAKQSRRGRGFSRFLLILFILILLWVVAGILMDFGFIPHFDLGYGWFNVNVFPLFTFGT